jgi:tetratricopeptide (TPR) repeat protein
MLGAALSALIWTSSSFSATGAALLDRALTTIRGGDIRQGAAQLKASFIDIVRESCLSSQQRLKVATDQAERTCVCYAAVTDNAYSAEHWQSAASKLRVASQAELMALLKPLAAKAADACDQPVGGTESPEAKALLIDGSTAFRQGDFRVAASKFEAAHKLLQSQYGAGHLETANTAVALGSALLRGNRPAEAVTYFNAALATQRVKLGERHADLLSTMSLLTIAHLELRQFEEALAPAEAGYRLGSELLGARHEATKQCAYLLSTVYRAKGRTADALVLQQQLLRIHEEAQDGPKVARLSREVGDSLLTLGRDAAAISLYERLVRPLEAGAGPLAPAEAVDLRRLASLYENDGRGPEAERLRALLARRGERSAP